MALSNGQDMQSPRKGAPQSELLWRNSYEYNDLFDSTHYKATATRSGFIAFFMVAAAIILQIVIAVEDYTSKAIPSTALLVLRITQGVLLSLAVLALIGVSIKYVSARKAFIDRVRLDKSTAVTRAVDDAAGAGLDLGALFKINRAQLDEYQTISVRQQKVAFQAAQLASAAAFAVVIVGAIVALRQSPGSVGQYVTGGLAAIGTALSTFVANIFFKSYQTTSDQLRRYYEEPIRTSRALGIERLLEKAPFDSRVSTGQAQQDAWKDFLKRLGDSYIDLSDREPSAAVEAKPAAASSNGGRTAGVP